MSIDISYNNSINCFNLLYYIITITSFTVSFTLVNVFQYRYVYQSGNIVVNRRRTKGGLSYYSS